MCTLTKEQLRALRTAYGFCVHAQGESAHITIDLESSYDKPYDDVARVRFAIGLYTLLPGKVAFVSVSTARYHELWQSIVSLLRVGDKLWIIFRPDYISNGYTRAARGTGYDPEYKEDSPSLYYEDLHADCADIVIERKNQTLTFRLETSICPANGARMIRDGNRFF